MAGVEEDNDSKGVGKQREMKRRSNSRSHHTVCAHPSRFFVSAPGRDPGFYGLADDLHFHLDSNILTPPPVTR